VDGPGVDAELDDGSEEGPTDEPAVIFEVPPAVTDTDIRNALGEDRLHEIDQLLQLRGTDALGWYMTFHQKAVQHGVYIPLEGVLKLGLDALQTA
ncbi:MAG: hypothetical protein QOI01_11, partial [Mycobacterium sp.]|nr:hypothetical protein [Mycobacterium sp.]